MKRKWTWILRLSLFTVLMCVLLALSMGAVRVPDRDLPLGRGLPPGMRKSASVSTPEEMAAKQRRLAINFHLTDVSLDVREIDDFLLTPALLVQEAVSDGVILTYPEE